MIRVAIVGYGNVGRGVLAAIKAAPDMKLVGIVRRNIPENPPAELAGIQIVSEILALSEKPQVAILCTPTRSVEKTAAHCLKSKISTVDCFDIHGEILTLRKNLGEVAAANGVTAVVAAGWDPGSDSIVRAVMEALAPKGITYTNFGPGMSMGHSVAIKALDGVKDAVSYTIPLGSGVHRRMCYIECEEGVNQQRVKKALLEDEYFKRDETHVRFVESVNEIMDQGHAVDLLRRGVSGSTHNQKLQFIMSINNPALTAQVMVASARAALRQAPGAYTMIELPPVDLLPGEREGWVKKLV